MDDNWLGKNREFQVIRLTTLWVRYCDFIQHQISMAWVDHPKALKSVFAYVICHVSMCV